jgi:hypothetical protein
LGFNEPTVLLGSSFLYEEGDGADEDLRENLPLALAQCPAGGVKDGSLLTVEDFTQKLSVSSYLNSYFYDFNLTILYIQRFKFW